MSELNTVKGSDLKSPSRQNVCFICRRLAYGVAVSGRGGFGHRFICEDHPIEMARRAALLPREFAVQEQHALDLTLDRIGTYIEKIGKTDLVTMEVYEIKGLITAIINEFSGSLNDVCDGKEPPF